MKSQKENKEFNPLEGLVIILDESKGRVGHFGVCHSVEKYNGKGARYTIRLFNRDQKDIDLFDNYPNPRKAKKIENLETFYKHIKEYYGCD